MLLQRLAMCRTIASAASHGGSYDHRHLGPTLGYKCEFRGVIQKLVESERQEIAEHQLHDRDVASHRKAAANTNNACLADGSVADPFGIPQTQVSSHMKRATVGRGYVLA